VRRLVPFVLLLAGCGVELEHGLDERQANQVIAALAENGIAADKEADGQGSFTISVGRADTARAVEALEARDLPRPRVKEPSGSLFLPSAVEERARLAATTAAELERTLEALPDVLAARVHVALPPEELLPGETPRVRPSASVMVKTRGARQIVTADVQRLVAGAVPSLQPSDVAVLVAPGPGDVTPEMERLGPLRVAKESRATAATLAASGLVVIALLALGLALLGLRLQRARRRLRRLEG